MMESPTPKPYPSAVGLRSEALTHATKYPDRSRIYAGVMDVRDVSSLADLVVAVKGVLGPVGIAVERYGVCPNAQELT